LDRSQHVRRAAPLSPTRRRAWFVAAGVGLAAAGVAQASAFLPLPAAPGYVHEVFGTGEVLASHGAGAWSARPAALAIVVVPRFYETGWFLALAGVAAAAALAALLRLRGAALRARQRQLERLVAERTATIAEQAGQLQEIDRLRLRFFANVSHELRTPLTLVLGPLDDALSGAFGPLDAALARQLEVAVSNARRLLGLVDQLLDLARLDADRLAVDLQPADLREPLRRWVESFLPLAERHAIELSLGVPAEPVELPFDPAPSAPSGPSAPSALWAPPSPRPLRVSAVAVTSADDAFLARVRSLVESRLDDTALSVEALAAALGCDRSYLLRKLSALTGESPSELIRSLRLQRAEQLLRGGAGAVSEIAYAVGFKSLAHFSNAFQKRYGERPSAFAARHRRS
jgi:AraC-like DNA-binding protein